MRLDENRFIQETTRCLFSSLQIETALFETFNYLRQFFPLDIAHMFTYDTSRRTLRYLSLATEKSGILIDERIQISSQATREIMSHALETVCIYTKSESYLIQEIFSHFQLNTSNPLLGDTEEFSALAIVFDIGKPLAGGFGMVSKGKGVYSPDHKKRLKLISSALSGSVLNLLHHRDIVCQNERLTSEKNVLRKRLGHISAQQIIGAETGLKEVMELVQNVAPTGSPVLITGETGVGKEVIANAIHQASRRSDGPFICINCGAIPESLTDSELFGHEKGAFTGATELKRGYFEQANGGTIFLDEIGELPFASQVKLLRVLQSMEFLRVGGQRPVQVDVRLIAATNRTLLTMVQRHQFREDLWFRLNVFPIRIPPLRDRKEDIPVLAGYFALQKSREMNLDHVPEIPAESINQLRSYDWPGNIREFQNIIERALIVSKGSPLEFPNLKPAVQPSHHQVSIETSDFLSMDEMTIRHIKQALTMTGGRIDGKGGAAELLGMNPSTLRGRMRKFGIITKKIISTNP